MCDTDSTAEVKSKNANALGLYDMSGNVREWCFDYNNVLMEKVVRGGNWFPPAGSMQLATALSFESNIERLDTGFRLARNQ